MIPMASERRQTNTTHMSVDGMAASNPSVNFNFNSHATGVVAGVGLGSGLGLGLGVGGAISTTGPYVPYKVRRTHCNHTANTLHNT